MKRIIDGTAYNTKTAQKVAQDEYEWVTTKYHRSRGFRIEDTPTTVHTTLYRTKGGAFFLVEEKVLHLHEKEKAYVDLTPVTYDEAYEWVRYGSLGNSDGGDVEILVEGIFPTRP